MVLFLHVSQVCCLFSVMVPTNSYVLFAASVDDFRNLAKKFIPEELAEKLTDLVSQNGSKGVKENVDETGTQSVRTNLRGRTTAIKNGDAPSEMPMHRIEEDNRNRPNEQSNQKSLNKYADYETQDTNINKKTNKYHDDATTQTAYVRKRIRTQEIDERHFSKRTTKVELENDEKQSNRPRKNPMMNNFQRERIQNPNVRKRPRDDIFESDSTMKKIPPNNRQENLQNERGYNNNKKSNLDSQFANEEKQNSYLKKLPINNYENEESDNRGKNIRNEMNTQKSKLQLHHDYDYQDITTRYKTLEDKRHRTFKNNRISTNLYDQGMSNQNHQYDYAVNPRETLYLKRERVEKIGEQNQRIVSPEAAKREENYGMRQVKETAQFDIQEPNNNGNAMRIKYGRNVREGKLQKQKIMQNDQIYEKKHMNKLTTHDEELTYENPYPPKRNTPIKEDDYFEEGKLNPPAPPRTGISIPQKQVTDYDIFYSAEHDTSNKNIGKNYSKKQVTEEDTPEYVEVLKEPIKARTESLNFDVDYDNNTGRMPVSRHVMKGTGIPTREVYKMSSPDYYKRLPRIVEKYDFSEPIPEADRVREVPDDKYVVEPGRVNKKVRQQQTRENREAFQQRQRFIVQRPEFEPIAGRPPNEDLGDMMEEFSLIRRY